MWEEKVAKLLSFSGWGTGFRLPLADDENKCLEKELEKRQRLLQEKHAELDNLVKANNNLEKGVKNGTDKIAHDARLITARQGELRAETDLMKSFERDGAAMIRECKRLQGVYKKLADRNRILTEEVDYRRRYLGEVADLIEFDRKELAFLEKQAADEEVFLNWIETVCEEDKDELEKHETRYRKANSEVNKLLRDIDGKVAMTGVLQSELDSLTDRFKKLHRERSDIVEMWKETITTLSERDLEMQEIGEEYAMLDSELKKAVAEIDSEREKLVKRERVAGSASLQLDKWDRKVSDLREEIRNLWEHSEELKNDMLSLQTIIANGSDIIQQNSCRSLEINAEVEHMHTRIKKAQEKIAELRRRASETCGDRTTVEGRLKEIEDLLDEEERKLEGMQRELEKGTEKRAFWMQKKRVLSEKTQTLEHIVKGNRISLQNQIALVRDAEYNLEQRKAEIVRMDLFMINLELRYKPLMNTKAIDPNQFRDLEEHIIRKKGELDQIDKKRKFLEQQTKHLANIAQRIYRERMTSEKEKKALADKADQFQSRLRHESRNVDILADEFQNLVVEHSLIKLKLEQIYKALKEHKCQLHDSAYQKQLLSAAVKEKRVEIEAHTRLLEIKKRGMEDELSKMKVQTYQVITTISKKRDRYDITMTLLSKKQDDNSSENGGMQDFIVGLAKERESLRIESQKWEKRVKDAEAELLGLQNNLALVKSANDRFQDSLKPIGDEEFALEMDNLKGEEHSSLVRKAKANQAQKNLRELLREMTAALEVADHQHSYYTNRAVEKEYEFKDMLMDIKSQAEVINRARDLTRKLLKELEFTQADKKATATLEIKLRATRRKFEFALHAFMKLLNLHTFVKPMVEELLVVKFGMSSNQLEDHANENEDTSQISEQDPTTCPSSTAENDEQDG